MSEILARVSTCGLDPVLARDRWGIAVPDMAELVAAGEALPLLPEVDVGPTFHQGTWWVVDGAAPDRWIYIVAAAADQLELTATYLLLMRSTEIVAEIAEERRRDLATAATTDDVPASWPR